jgi:hypothetical protein
LVGVEEEERDGLSHEEDTSVKNFWWGNLPDPWKSASHFMYPLMFPF